MAKLKVKSGGGWPAIRYSFRIGKKAGGVFKFYRALRSSNTCKTCAVGMGGVSGGMRNKLGQGFQVCKKSMQAQAQDMQAGIPAEFFENTSIDDLSKFTGRDLESLGRLVHPLFLSEGATHFQAISWEDAQTKLLKNWQAAIPDRSFLHLRKTEPIG